MFRFRTAVPGVFDTTAFHGRDVCGGRGRGRGRGIAAKTYLHDELDGTNEEAQELEEQVLLLLPAIAR